MWPEALSFGDKGFGDEILFIGAPLTVQLALASLALGLLLGLLNAAMGLSPAEVGLLITITHVGAALGYLPAGVLADRVTNRGRLLLGTFWWVAIGYLAASFAPGFWTLALMLAIAGIGDENCGACGSRASTQRRGRMGFHTVASSTG